MVLTGQDIADGKMLVNYEGDLRIGGRLFIGRQGNLRRQRTIPCLPLNANWPCSANLVLKLEKEIEKAEPLSKPTANHWLKTKKRPLIFSR